MSKFATRTPALPPGPIRATGTPTQTFEGGAAVTRDAKSDLFLLAAANMVGEDTFYEAKGERDARFRALIHDATTEDPDWVARFVPYLRGEMNMRSASVVMAAESALARRASPDAASRATISVRGMVAGALQRPDEPAEFIAYWRSRAGIRALPGGVQRGVADAVTRLFTERAALKYDGVNNAFRLADVIALAKPTPADLRQADLFDFLADRRWNRDPVRVTDRLPVVSAYMRAKAMPEARRRAFFLADPRRLAEAGMTWEELSSLGPMDRAAWTAIIPSLGIMAAARNLRNLDEAGVPDDAVAPILAKFTDPEQVARSRMFPYRWLSAYRAAPSLRWGHALERALTAATAAIPHLPGRTLVLVDTSSSMTGPVSSRSTIRHVDVGALIGVALAYRGAQVDLVGFADGVFRHPVTPGGSMLRDLEAFTRRIGEVGHGTQTIGAIEATFAGHDRVIVVTDGQAFRAGGYYGGLSGMYGNTWYGRQSGIVAPRARSVSDAVPQSVPLFGIDTTGYGRASVDTSQPNRFEVGGFSDKVFTMFGLLASGRGADWPF